MTKKAKIFGKELDVKSEDYKLPGSIESKFKLVTCIEVSATRSQNKPVEVEFKENDLLALQFTDGTEWIGHPDDIQDIYDKKTLEKRSRSTEDYLFESQISSIENSRGIVERAVVKLFSVFRAKKLAKISMKTLSIRYDKRIQPNPGLYFLDADFNKKPFKKKPSNSAAYLLLIHGTLSTSIDAFRDLNNNNTAWNKIAAQYGDNILALEHYTLSESPLSNVLDFLNSCPDDCTIDILSHSRGGLVADLLAKCDIRNSTVGFSTDELQIVKGDDKREDKTSHALMLEINTLARKKKIKVGKVVRVASPASGTTILSRRVDHFFNLLLNAVSLAFGVRNPLYETVKSFLLELIRQKEDPDVLAGLNSMMPESLFQKMLNASDTVVVSNLYSVAGDSDIGGITFSSLKVILANLFYRDANDLVVDTKRMGHGINRVDGIYKFLSKGSETNHFKYFSNEDSSHAIVQALQATIENPAEAYTKHVYTEGEGRGVVLKLLSLKGVTFKPKEITRDVVIIIPGIMGSSLSANKEAQWVDMREINKGAIVKNLNIDATDVKVTGVIEKFYVKLKEHLSPKYDVISLEFDWRKSLTEAAEKLKTQLNEIRNNTNVTVHIVAHSMGGLVARQCMMDHSKVWSDFSENKNNKFVMLGTPWLGSYLIMEVLTGHSKRVKQLAAIDFRNDKSDLLKIFWNFPGVFELLPVEKLDNRDFASESFWTDLDDEANLRHMPETAEHLSSLTEFQSYREKVTDFLENIDEGDFDNIYYICGKADKTVYDYTLKKRFLSSKKKLIYTATSYGDGSVTWKSGIPSQLLKSSRLYYTNTSHGDLANEEYIFDGVSDILANGSTNKLKTQPPISRGGEIISEVHEYSEPLYDSNAVVESIFNTEKPSEPEIEAINVTVVNGDLKVSSYPVMVGHFFMDLILSAEKALDGYLNNRLSQRLGIGYYPGKIGESEVFFNLKTQPKGAIVCGLGDTEALTSFLLSKTIKLAVLKYAMFMRDNYTLPEAKKYATGISFILIAIGYGKLAIKDSLKGILLGVSAANKYIKDTGEDLKVIKDIEIINFYQSVSSQAYFSLSRMCGDATDNRISFNLEKGVVKRAGAKKRQLYAQDIYDWWHTIQITSIILKENVRGFKYYSSSGLARVEQEIVSIGLKKIERLLEKMSGSNYWDKRLSKTLFEMLIPNQFKDIFRNQNNLILKLDKHAAQIPWELLHDIETDDTPAAVTSAFIRQLITENTKDYKPVGLNNVNALVIGDPSYDRDDLPPLPAAKDEGIWVGAQLNKQDYKTYQLINESSSAIMMELFNRQYKIMHFSGHGVYNPGNDEVGIAIGDGIFIDPAMINQAGVPEFVFINCCYSGTMDAADDNYSRDRYKLAANIGTQLIEMGVKAIIISGWAVDDAAARTFSETFYKKMFEGDHFGNAVQKARLECFQNHSETNTWGAYQCYGNQFYKFDNRQKSKKNDLEYVIDSQVHTDMDNLLIAIREQKYNTKKTLRKLDKYLDKAMQANLMDAVVLEKEALIYDELGESDIALRKFKELFLYDSGNFSIEALEQYCTIKSYKLNKKTLESDLMEIEFLTLVGRNPSRLNIVANAYKLASTLFDDEKKKQIDYLVKAFDFYKEAYEASNNKYSGHSLDAVTNMIFVGHILELLNEGKLLERIKGCSAFKNVSDVDTYLSDFYQDLEDYDKKDLDISVLIGMAETSYGLILLKSKFKLDIEINIIEKFKHIFQLLYSPRYINIELMQIDFLVHYISDKTILKQLEQIRNEVEKLIK